MTVTLSPWREEMIPAVYAHARDPRIAANLRDVFPSPYRYEDVEVFVNGQSLGIQVLPPFWYDISGALKDGRNTLRIEVATTLERERKTNKKKWQPTGLTGAVSLIGY